MKLWENRNIKHLPETLVKIEKTQKNNVESMQFDREADVIVPSEAGTNKNVMEVGVDVLEYIFL